jgi:16S rRNA (cytidine1402-2'-O)-methyltransferase
MNNPSQNLPKKTGTLFLIPNTLGDENREAQLTSVLPHEVIVQSAKLTHWVVENAKTARSFLKAIGTINELACPIQEMHMTEWRGSKSNVDPKELIKPLLAGHDLGLMSEAGLPAVADPGSEIVAAAHQANIQVVPLTGPSSLMLALMASGMNGQRFLFHGYLPIKNPERTSSIKSLEAESRKFKQTQLWIETPYRNAGMLETLTSCLSDSTQLCVAIDLSLPTQQVLSMPVSKWRPWIKANAKTIESLDKRPAVFLLLA